MDRRQPEEEAMPKDDPRLEIPERLPPLAQSADAEPAGAEPGGGSGDWHAPGADSPDDVEEPVDE
ncbi:hypothetical protein GCM10010116_01710 [Microbispora rosea subsp. aerata]|nr:hypothetical protein [Microbispora rosea]GGO00999.1 hypothetical protein GCM10010116_01710 [Microbispora rosea subsp. aerata]GIH56427.1 hypothetical protein Mro02_33410 [Microbispora rosea subsp. aerata]GLJ84407.1 hypothetical protein GCM10017588_31350 [Microbispora rosea subsp. aerata]